VDRLLFGIKQGDTATLARAITLIESTREGDREMAYNLIEQCLPINKRSVRVGITGIPGVGKSTFIEALGEIVTRKGHKVAVLAIDPTSSLSKGSIMGDKTRMQELARNPLAFIRPSPTAENLGGVARNTREAMILCEAAGFDIILIETVGVGQSETAVHSMVDFFLLLQLAGAGDELQGIKRGIVEMADAILINKADGGNRRQAAEAKSAYERALQLYPPKENGWIPKVLTSSALERTGIMEIWQLIVDYIEKYRENGYLPGKRREQNKYWFKQTIDAELSRNFYSHRAVRKQLELLMKQLEEETISPFRAAAILLRAYRGDHNSTDSRDSTLC
jgi:LAO/AO transport system kinase